MSHAKDTTVIEETIPERWQAVCLLKEKHLVALYVSEETLLNQVSRLPLFWNGLPDEVYQRVRPHFTDEELANLTLAVATINTWNRVCISFRVEEGSYQPKQTTSN